MTNSIKDVLKPKTSNNKSSKNPAYYNAEKTKCILKGALNENVEVRKYFATNPHTPVSVLTEMLKQEQDKEVLRTILTHKNMKRKTVLKFVSDERDERVKWFDNDVELIAHFKQE